MAKSKVILLAVGLVAVAGIVYLAVDGRVVPKEEVVGAIGTAERHQMEKTRYYEDLNKRDKIENLGRIAAKFETAPDEAEKMLEENGWSKEDFDRMVRDIRSDAELSKVFEEAKKRASQD